MVEAVSEERRWDAGSFQSSQFCSPRREGQHQSTAWLAVGCIIRHSFKQGTFCRDAGSFLSRFFSPRQGGQPLAGNGVGGEAEDAQEVADLTRRLDEADLPPDVHKVHPFLSKNLRRFRIYQELADLAHCCDEADLPLWMVGPNSFMNPRRQQKMYRN